MAKAKTIFLPLNRDEYHNSGIDITYVKSTQVLRIGGWYDSCVGIEGGSFTLKEFFDLVGISFNDCKKAFKDEQSN